jgi:hypothetical protein
MSLPKKTIRTEVPEEVHKGLKVLVDLSRFGTIERYVEALIARHVVSEAKEAIMRADQFQRAGIDGSFRESQFDPGMLP